MFIKLYEKNPCEKEIAKVVEILRDGGLIIYPTDTVYALGCDITNARAVEKIAKIKGIKPQKANFSFVCCNLSSLSQYTKQIDSWAFKILKRNLPGAFTFVLKAGGNLPKMFRDKKTIGIRVPDSNIAREIVKALENPIVSTSIYDQDQILEYTTDPELIYEKWKNIVDVVIDGGYGGNVASTVVDLTGIEAQILRKGKAQLIV